MNFGQGISKLSHLLYGQIFGQMRFFFFFFFGKLRCLSSKPYLFVARGDTETEGYARAL